ncbi:MAG: hypothetical protein HXY50_04780 [Ignavibacteriaceae bacterium]|nr:hypothetical protein [Ignavibacteriaceae bacterium]
MTKSIFLAFIFSIVLYINVSGEYKYNMEIRNGAFVDDKTYEFEVYIKANVNSFILNAYQCSFSLNRSIVNYGSLSFHYIDGSSELVNKPIYGVGISVSYWLPIINFASFAGGENISLIPRKVGKFRLINTMPFADKYPALKWNFGNASPTIILGEGFKEITDPYSHTYGNIGFPLYLGKGWNFISIPIKLTDMSTKSIFKYSLSSAFLCSDYGYEAVDSLEVGKAYWIQLSQETILMLKGEYTTFLIPVVKGWNSIGVSYCNLPVASIITNPTFIITSVFGSNNAQYYNSNLLESGKGYLLYSEQEGYIIINPNKPIDFSLQ